MIIKGSKILTTLRTMPVEDCRKGQQVQIVDHTVLSRTEEIQSISSVDFRSSVISLTLEGETRPVCLHPQARLLNQWSVDRQDYTVVLMECGDFGFGLALLEGLPKSLAESPICVTRTLYRSWGFQKLWFLQAFSVRDEAWLFLYTLSLQYGLPVLESKQLGQKDGSVDLYNKLMTDLKTSALRPKLDELFHIGNAPDMVAITELSLQDPVFGFIVRDYPDRNQIKGARLFLYSANLEPDRLLNWVTIVNKDLVMVREHFLDSNQAAAWLDSMFPDRRTEVMLRNYAAQRVFRTVKAEQVAVGSYCIGLSANGQPGLRRIIGRSELPGSKTVLFDMRLLHGGFVFVDNLGLWVEGQ